MNALLQDWMEEKEPEMWAQGDEMRREGKAAAQLQHVPYPIYRFDIQLSNLSLSLLLGNMYSMYTIKAGNYVLFLYVILLKVLASVRDSIQHKSIFRPNPYGMPVPCIVLIGYWLIVIANMKRLLYH